MSVKKFTFTFFSLFIISYVLLYLVYYLVNPEQEFDNSITGKKFFNTKEYSRKQFDALKKDNSILIFGSSQIHKISTKMMGHKILNFHNLYGEPGDIINFLHHLDANQIKHIDKILYCVDLRAGAMKMDEVLIDYSKKKVNYPIMTMEKFSRTIQDLQKNNSPLFGYLNIDGSIEHINQKKHIGKKLPSYFHTASLKYDENLIGSIFKINRFAQKYHKEILFFTPVVNEKYFKTIDFEELSRFYSVLLKGGIKHIGLFYYISGLSNIKNDKLEYISFIDPGHLNTYFVKQWLKQYILKDNEYIISNQVELDVYTRKIEAVQAAIK